MDSEREREALLEEYRAIVQFYMHTNQITQNRVNWSFVVQGALLAAVLQTNELTIQLLACTMGIIIGFATFLILGRHKANVRQRAFRGREVESLLRANLGTEDVFRTFASEKEAFGPADECTKRLCCRWLLERCRRVAKCISLPWPSGRDLRPSVTNESFELQAHARFSANDLEQLVVGVFVPVAWIFVLWAVVAGRLGSEAADWGFFIGFGRR
jgi:hypothetical protein